MTRKSVTITVCSEALQVKLFLICLLLTLGSTALAQSRESQTGCPLYLENASVGSLNAVYRPTGSHSPNGRALDLLFRNQSGKAIKSASITARFFGKRNIYQLDAHEFDVHMTIQGVNGVDKTKGVSRAVRLPDHIVVYEAATLVMLDKVMFADGSEWTASPRSSVCQTGWQPGPEKVAK